MNGSGSGATKVIVRAYFYAVAKNRSLYLVGNQGQIQVDWFNGAGRKKHHFFPTKGLARGCLISLKQPFRGFIRVFTGENEPEKCQI